MVWDVVNGKVIEFSYISEDGLFKRYYDLDIGKICDLQRHGDFVKQLEYILEEYI
jgi:hypothetical protein